MCSLIVRYIGLIRNVLGKQEEIIDVPETATVRDLLRTLGELYGKDFAMLIFGSDGKLRPTASLVLDDVIIDQDDDLDIQLGNRQKLSILALAHLPAGG